MTQFSRTIRRVPRLDLLALAVFALTLILTILPGASPAGAGCPVAAGPGCAQVGAAQSN